MREKKKWVKVPQEQRVFLGKEEKEEKEGKEGREGRERREGREGKPPICRMDGRKAEKKESLQFVEAERQLIRRERPVWRAGAPV